MSSPALEPVEVVSAGVLALGADLESAFEQVGREAAGLAIHTVQEHLGD